MGVAASKLLPEQERRSRYIPLEIVEEILLNLPVKSLLRFSTVSKSWNSMIFDAGFIRRHRTRAALPGRVRIFLSHLQSLSLSLGSTIPLSSISSNRAINDAAPLFSSPFEGVPENSRIQRLASCGELWCVERAGSLYLWNPSMRTYRKLPHDVLAPHHCFLYHFYFGIGYDSLSDDFKILKISKECNELYSLRSDSWKKMQPFPGNCEFWEGLFVSGALHWMTYPDHAFRDAPHEGVIVSFNLSTEKYAEVAQPPYYPQPRFRTDRVQLSVLRGKLCLHLNYRIIKFVLWMMQEYGVGKSWTKMFEIDFSCVYSYIQFTVEAITLVPLYFYDNGEILIKIMAKGKPAMFMYIDGKSIPQIFVSGSSYCRYSSGHLYVESLISPATYCGP